MTRDLISLPKAHLHLHFTGAMRHQTMLDLALEHGLRLPDALLDPAPQRLSAKDERGWFRFQRLYDHARDVIRTAPDVRRLVREIAEDEAADGSGWLEIQVDPSGYAARFDGVTAFLELVLDAAADAAASSGVGIGIIVGANRTRHPLDARILARLAAQYAGRGVVGFGLANDERRGRPEDFARAFHIARDAGLASVPHGGELLGAASVHACLEHLGADRVGHGIRSVEDRDVLREVVEPRSPSRSARPPTSASASMPRRRTYRCGPSSMPAPGWPSVRTTLCCSGPDSLSSTSSRASPWRAPMRSWPRWRDSPSRARVPPRTSGPDSSPASTSGCPLPRSSSRVPS